MIRVLRVVEPVRQGLEGAPLLLGQNMDGDAVLFLPPLQDLRLLLPVPEPLVRHGLPAAAVHRLPQVRGEGVVQITVHGEDGGLVKGREDGHVRLDRLVALSLIHISFLAVFLPLAAN